LLIFVLQNGLGIGAIDSFDLGFALGIGMRLGRVKEVVGRLNGVQLVAHLFGKVLVLYFLIVDSLNKSAL